MQMIMSAGWKQTTVTRTQIVLILSVVLLVNVKMALWGMVLPVKVSQSMVISGPRSNSHHTIRRIRMGESENVTPLSATLILILTLSHRFKTLCMTYFDKVQMLWCFHCFNT